MGLAYMGKPGERGEPGEKGDRVECPPAYDKPNTTTVYNVSKKLYTFQFNEFL